MTDFSKWTDEQVNEAVFKANGWVKLPFPAIPKWQRPSKDGVEYWYISLIPDYTHDWRRCGELLEEMGDAIKDGWEFSCEHSDLDGLEPLKWRVWMTRFTDNPEDFRSVCAISDNPKRAIAEGYLMWLEAK